MYHRPKGNAIIRNNAAHPKNIDRLTLKTRLISSLFPLPIATDKNLLHVATMMVFTIIMNEIKLPRTENSPKSLIPNAINAYRVVKRPNMALINIFAYVIIELTTIALFVFSFILNL